MKTNLLKSIFISLILLVGATNAWANGGIGYKGVKFTKDGTTTGWYNIHNVTWDYVHSSYECRSGKSGVTDFNNADLGIVTSLKLHSFVVIGWTDNSDWVSGQLKYRTYLQSASAGNYSIYNVGNYETYCNATDVLATSGNNRVVGKNGTMNITLVDDNTTPGKYYLQLQGMGRMRWCNGDFNTNNGSEVKASYIVPGFTTTSTSQNFDNTIVNSNSSKTISFSAHYGTALKTGDCSLSGTNGSEFSVTSITESSVTVQFKPTSTGNKSATLTIKDAHNKTCTITLTGKATPPTYTVTFGVHSSGNGTLTAKAGSTSISSGASIDKGTTVVFTAAPSTGYQIEGWYSNSTCTTSLSNGTNTTYTINSLTAAANVYVKFEAIPANNHNITYTTQGTGWTYGTTPASAKEGAQVTFEVIPTTGYTVSVTSSDVTLNKNENEYTFTMPTKDVAINVSAVENTHNVIVSYKCGDETIKADATVETVGEVTPTSVTAPEIDGYAFDSWTLGSGIQSANTTANPISITTKASGDYTLTANYTKMVTVYLINNSNWAKVYAYGWKNGEAQGTPAWPGAEITANKLAEKYEGYDVYSYKVEEGSYDNIIFNNNSGKQTETFAWTDGKYYYAVDPLGSNVYLAGDMNEWNGSADELKKETAEGTTASIKVNLTAKTYEFKLVIDGAWKANTGTMQRGGQSVHEGGWSFDKDGYDDKCKLVADIAGDYTFTWNLETKKLTVTYPALPKYQVTATVDPAETGEVTGTGEYEHGSEATLVATPAAGYAFKNWTVGGTEMSTEATYTFTVNEPISLVANFIPEETNEVTISYLCNSNPIPGHDATTLAVGVTTPSTITAPAITHYTFDSWTVGTGVLAVDAKANPIQITTKAEGDYTLAANYTKIELTYNVQVPDGTEKCFIAGSMNGWSFTEMTKIDDTHYTITIDGATKEMEYKYACQASWDYVEKQANGEDVGDRTYSANDKVAKWADPLATNVYLAGAMNSWSTNTHEFKKPSTKDDTIASVTLKDLNAGTYEFKIIVNGDWLGNIGIMKRGEIGVHEGGWSFTSDTENCKLEADIAGEYTFTWNINAKKLTVTYPTKDYRLVYVESESGGAPYTKFHASQPIHYQIEGEKRDTISFYINKEGQNPAILLQQCEVDNGSATWNTIATQSINGVQGGDPGQAKAPTKRAPELKIGNGFPNIESSGVYNFVLEQTNNNAEHNAQILSQETHAYVGNYYIRTDAAEGGWNNYKTTPNNIMTYSQNVHGNYNYYFCAWVLKDQNVKYVVANDYSYCISDTLASDDIVTNVHGNLPADANVRYTWNSQTNALERAYLSGSGNAKDHYLVLVGDNNLQNTSGQPFTNNEAYFKDMDNWLYQLDVKANKNTRVKLTADYNGETQYFKGGADTTVQLIKGADDYYTLRLIYDFKTNYLVSGLVGNQTITDTLELEEVMIVRSHHDEAQTLKISNGSVTANKAYGVMTFNNTTLNDNSKSQYERALYWVSFPFDVQLDKVFGFGNYGEHWIMEYYDGAERAEKGLWKEPTYSYWKYITDPTNYTLEAGQGYVLCLDLDLLGNDSEFWDHENTEIALYFPSDGQNAIVIDNNPADTTITVDAHKCSIERDDRDEKDSNWNIIGIPAYTKIAEINSQNLNFYYQYIAGDDPETEDIDETNSYRVQKEPTFNTMHAYMVQFAGEINWMEKVVSFAAIAARKSPASKNQYTLRLALQQEGTDHDHTFIRLQEDNATAEFDMNYDLCKIINRGANIYSMINNVEVAANVLPMEERVIPLGLDIHETGNYTFAMPDGTDGITAILIDYETGKETNLLLADYTTELREGTNNGRFALRVRPNHVATEVETIIDGANGQIQKYIINGALYILNNGQLYDAQGRMVQP